jgi:hypothetical protein
MNATALISAPAHSRAAAVHAPGPLASLRARPGNSRPRLCGAKWGIAGAPVPVPILPPLCSTGADLQVCCTKSRRRARLRVDGGAMWGTVERGGVR